MSPFSVFDRGQIRELALHLLEESYPAVEDWKRATDQVKSMSGIQKIKLARRVGNTILQPQFENERSNVFRALT